MAVNIIVKPSFDPGTDEFLRPLYSRIATACRLKTIPSKWSGLSEPKFSNASKLSDVARVTIFEAGNAIPESFIRMNKIKLTLKKNPNRGPRGRGDRSRLLFGIVHNEEICASVVYHGKREKTTR